MLGRSSSKHKSVEVPLRGRRTFVALVAAVLLLFAGAARAMHSSARSKVIIWCDGINDQTDDAGCAAVENKKTGYVSPPDTPEWLHVSEGSPTSRDVRHACRAGAEVPRVTSLLFRPLLRTASYPSPRRSSDPY